MKLVLSRTQVAALHSMMLEYPDANSITLLVDFSSGIGVNIDAELYYAAGTRADSRDITDYEGW